MILAALVSAVPARCSSCRPSTSTPCASRPPAASRCCATRSAAAARRPASADDPRGGHRACSSRATPRAWVRRAPRRRWRRTRRRTSRRRTTTTSRRCSSAASSAPWAWLVLGAAIATRCWRLLVGQLPPAYAAVVPRAWLLVVVGPVMAVAAGFYEVLHFRHLWTWLGLVAALGAGPAGRGEEGRPVSPMPHPGTFVGLGPTQPPGAGGARQLLGAGAGDPRTGRRDHRGRPGRRADRRRRLCPAAHAPRPGRRALRVRAPRLDGLLPERAATRHPGSVADDLRDPAGRVGAGHAGLAGRVPAAGPHVLPGGQHGGGRLGRGDGGQPARAHRRQDRPAGTRRPQGRRPGDRGRGARVPAVLPARAGGRHPRDSGAGDRAAAGRPRGGGRGVAPGGRRRRLEPAAPAGPPRARPRPRGGHLRRARTGRRHDHAAQPPARLRDPRRDGGAGGPRLLRDRLEVRRAAAPARDRAHLGDLPDARRDARPGTPPTRPTACSAPRWSPTCCWSSRSCCWPGR